eukprot:754085-Hanusia_phi.AAC.1
MSSKGFRRLEEEMYLEASQRTLVIPCTAKQEMSCRQTPRYPTGTTERTWRSGSTSLSCLPLRCHWGVLALTSQSLQMELDDIKEKLWNLANRDYDMANKERMSTEAKKAPVIEVKGARQAVMSRTLSHMRSQPTSSVPPDMIADMTRTHTAALPSSVMPVMRFPICGNPCPLTSCWNSGEGILSWAKSLRIRAPRAEQLRTPRRLFESTGEHADSVRGSKSRSSLGSEKVRKSVGRKREEEEQRSHALLSKNPQWRRCIGEKTVGRRPTGSLRGDWLPALTSECAGDYKLEATARRILTSCEVSANWRVIDSEEAARKQNLEDIVAILHMDPEHAEHMPGCGVRAAAWSH